MFRDIDWIALFLVVLLSPTLAMADDKPAVQSDAIAAALGKSKPGGKSPSFTAEREAAALTFVRTNHPELAAVLDQLKAMQPEEYQRAIRDLFRISEDLSRIRDQDPAKYEIDVELWKAKSRVQLLAAQASIGHDKALEDQLKSAIEKQLDLQLAQLQLQRKQTAEKLKKLDESIQHLGKQKSQQAGKQFTHMLRTIKRSREAAKKQDQKTAVKDQPGADERAESK